jgi:hypothetical protein
MASFYPDPKYKSQNMATEKRSKESLDWAVQDAMRTLQAAEKIKGDKQVMAGVRKAAQDLQKVVGKPPSKSSPKTKK